MPSQQQQQKKQGETYKPSCYEGLKNVFDEPQKSILMQAGIGSIKSRGRWRTRCKKWAFNRKTGRLRCKERLNKNGK